MRGAAFSEARERSGDYLAGHSHVLKADIYNALYMR